MKIATLNKLMLFIAITFSGTISPAFADEPESPESYFGFEPGSDYNLFGYSELINYLEALQQSSGKIKLEEIGVSPMGKKIYIAFISSEENIARLQEYNKINKELALNPDLSDVQRKQYVENGKVFVLATLSMHSTEVGPSQSAPLIAYDLVTTKDPKKLQWMNDVVYMMVPSHNSDGMDMVETGKTKAPFYYILPEEQHDAGELVKMVDLLQEHDIEIYRLDKNMVIEDISFNEGDLVVPLAQPFRAFIKEVMEKQEFPARHYTPGGEMIKPYDITSWSLPLHRQVKSFEINTRTSELEINISKIEGAYSLQVPLGDARQVILPVTYNESFKTAFEALEKGIQVERLRSDANILGEKVQKGSFLISLSGKKGDQSRSLLESLRYPVIPVSSDIKFDTAPLKVPRIALVETYFHDMDAGWTRFVFDSYHIPYTKIRPHEIKEADIKKNFDVIIFPDVDEDLLMEGKSKSGEDYYQGNYHPDYTKGMGKEGKKALISYLDEGGKIISWGSSSAIFEGPLELKDGDEKEEFNLPFSDVSSKLGSEGLYVPGSLLKINLLEDHFLTNGLPSEIGVFSRGKPVFRTSLPGFDMDRRVIAAYADKNEVLLSGYVSGEKYIENQSAMIWLKKGEGELVLFGFNPQFRASTQASFKLLFNSILL